MPVISKNEEVTIVPIQNLFVPAYMAYAMEVIVSRALPDVRDGLKPVHRRILYSMYESHLFHNKAYKKSAYTIGLVIAKYHPHGDSSIYGAMVRLAQNWSSRYCLIDGQGNFGSIDNDPAAAYRYTEARLTKFAEEMLTDIKKETVDWKNNFDDSLKEPVVLPSRIPTLLVNGSIGIAVGIATNIAPHNLGEVINASIAYLENPNLNISDLMKYIKAPDFPTGGIIYGYDGVEKSFKEGMGRIVIRSVINIEKNKEHKQLVITEIPPFISKAALIERAAKTINDKKIDGVSDIRDESSGKGIRIVFELKRNAIAEIVINNLFKKTAFQSSFFVKNIALVDGKPKLLNIKQLIGYYIQHQFERIQRRARFDLQKAEERLHILEGFLIALQNIDKVVQWVRNSKNRKDAEQILREKISLSQIQTKNILEMRFHRLTKMEFANVQQEFNETSKQVLSIKELLASKSKQHEKIKGELLDIKEKYGDERKTVIQHEARELEIKDIIPNSPMVITISEQGYVKKTSLEYYNTQKRGGKGKKGVVPKKEDKISNIFLAHSHDYIFFFTEKGRVFLKYVYELPEGKRYSQGRAVQNLIQLEGKEKLCTILSLSKSEKEDYKYLFFVTQKGFVKKSLLQLFMRFRISGKRAISIGKGDKLIAVKLSKGTQDIFLATKSGKSIRFNEKEVRCMGVGAKGVIGIKTLGDHVTGFAITDNPATINATTVSSDQVTGLSITESDDTAEDKNLLIVSSKGYGKCSNLNQYKITHRANQGILSMRITKETGKVIALQIIKKDDDLLIITKKGVVLRLNMKLIRTTKRVTQGVRLVRLQKDDSIASVQKIDTNIMKENIDSIV